MANPDMLDRIINAVKKHPSIWDVNHKDYKDRELRYVLWQQIADETQMDVNTCKIRWKTAKDGYRKNKKKLKTMSGGTPTISRYNAENFKFMEKCFQKQTTDNREQSPDESEEETYIDDPPNENSNELPSANDSSNDLQATSNEPATDLYGSIPASERKRKHNFSVATRNKAEILLEEFKKNRDERNSILKQLMSQTSSNPLISFFTSLGQTVATFPPELVIETKRKVFEVVSQMELVALRQQTPAFPSASFGAAQPYT